MRRYVFKASVAGVFLMSFMLTGQFAVAQQNPEDDFQVLHIRGPIYMIAGAGSNITASVGLDGVFLVDTGSAAMSDKVIAAIRQIQNEVALRYETRLSFGAETRSSLEAERAAPAPPKPIRFIVNTSDDADHLGGNEKIAAVGRTFTGGNVAGDLGNIAETAAIYSHENVQLRVAGAIDGGTKLPEAAWPTDTYHSDYYKMSTYFNGEGIQLMHPPPAHTDGDSWVWFRGSDVISAGDIFSLDTYPEIHLGKGGDIQGVLDGLNTILDLAFAEVRSEGGTMIVPGHGRLGDLSDVAYYRDMLTIIRDRIQDLINKDMTLEQVKAAKPTFDYDPRYGATTGPWTTDMFIDAVYQSLKK
jgi:glyoxylase-like metal-dependent hydrolase (beta-lactamase superfamily II)